MKYRVTFIGGPETGGVDENVWGHSDGYHAIHGGPIVFPLREPIEIDPDGEKHPARKAFLAHVVKKAKTNRFFRVEEVRGPGRPPAEKGAD
jgi:hypothetical protein